MEARSAGGSVARQLIKSAQDVTKKTSVHSIRAGGLTLGRVRRTYWDVPPGKPLALIGSSGLLEIAVRDGSAAEDLKLKVGDEVTVE